MASQNLTSLLLHPFETRCVKNFCAGKTLLCGAQYDPVFSKFHDTTILQSFKPYVDLWEQQKREVLRKYPENQKFDNIFCVLPKQKEAAHYQLALSTQMLNDGGLLIAVAENEAGGKRLKKWFEELGYVATSVSKSKCRIVWGHKKNITVNILDQWIANGAEKIIQVEGKKFVTKPGIYGWKKIDVGSKLLAAFIPDDLKGIGADFGCGYGFLSREILEKNYDIQKLYAIEAEATALECAQKNLNRAQVEFCWEDLTTKPQNLPPLDWVVMNPPFHEGKQTDSDVGKKFIITASNALKKNGVLYMVANLYLPYEKTLQEAFTKIEKLAEQDGFKIYKAVK